MILLSLASKQIWPQILSLLYIKPERIILLHSADAGESRLPAQRVARLAGKQGLLPPQNIALECIPHDDFGGIERSLDALQTRLGLPLSECHLNFTGGNKLMATAAFRWAARRGITSFYLERGNQLTWFKPVEGELQTHVEVLDGHLADRLDPLALLRCQLDASEVEREGEVLALNQRGSETPLTELSHLVLVKNQDPLKFLDRVAPLAGAKSKGDRMEFFAGACLLKCGVNEVRRSVRLKVKPGPGMKLTVPHAEIDLLFNFGGRLWLVDCKDRKPAEDLISGIWPFIQRNQKVPGSAVSRLIGRIADELGMKQGKVLKEDLIAIREIGGLLGRALCVRRAPLPAEVEEYARLNGIALIYENGLATDLAPILDPLRKTQPNP